MSLNILPLKTVSVVDPRLNYNAEQIFSVIKAGQIVNNQSFPAQAPIGSSLTFNCTLPSRNTAVSRKMLLFMAWTYTVTGTNTSGGFLLQEGFFGPRSYPNHSAISNATIRVGDSAVTQSEINTYINQLMWYKQRMADEVMREMTISPVYPDQSMDYADTAASGRNPLAVYNDSSSLETSRGGFSGFSVETQTINNTTAVVHLNCCEEILISPFVYGQGSDMDTAFIGLDQINFSFSLDLSRGLSIQQNQGVLVPSTLVIEGITSRVDGANLIMQYITPPLTIPRPMRVAYPYASIVRYQTSFSHQPFGARNFQIPANNIQLNSIPRALYIYAARADASRTSFMTDAVFPVAGANGTSPSAPLTIQYNNNPGFFTTTTSYDLYLMCVKNGLQMSYTQWSREVGSIICIDVGSGDLGLSLLESPSLNGNYNLQITCRFDNYFPDPDGVDPVLNVIAVYDGVFNIIDGSSSTTQSVLSAGDINAAKTDDHVAVFEKSVSITGGSFLSDAVKTISGIAMPLLPPRERAAVTAAKSVYCNKDMRKGLCGDGLMQYSGGAASGGAYSGGCGEGCGCAPCKRKMRGGRVMSKAQLARSLM